MTELFTTDGFLPRGACGNFDQGYLYWRLIVANVGYTVAFWLMPVLLSYFTWRVGRDQYGWWQRIGLAVVFFFCGATHATQVFVWFWPAYFFIALVHDIGLVTAVASVVCFSLFIPRALKRKRHVDLERENEAMAKRLRELEEIETRSIQEIYALLRPQTGEGNAAVC